MINLLIEKKYAKEVKVVHENFLIIQNEVGILGKVCLACGWESRSFHGLTSDFCFQCMAKFKLNHNEKIGVAK